LYKLKPTAKRALVENILLAYGGATTMGIFVILKIVNSKPKSSRVNRPNREITGKPVKPAIQCIDFVIIFINGGFQREA